MNPSIGRPAPPPSAFAGKPVDDADCRNASHTNQNQDRRKADKLLDAAKARFQSQYDIVGSLPLELVLAIVKYLDSSAIVRNRRVSKRWHSVFSCDAVTESALRQSLSFLNLEGIDEHAADATAYIRWQHGLQSGRPVKRIFLPWTERELGVFNVWYHSRRLFYHTYAADDIEVLDLETGERSTLIEQASWSGNKETLVSDSHVIHHDYGYLTAWNIHTKQQCAGGDFPCFPNGIHLQRDKVVIADRLGEMERFWFLHVWDLSSNRIEKYGRFTDLCLWHLDWAENLLITFEINWNTPQPEVQQTKWTLMNGQPCDRRRFHLPISRETVDQLRPTLESCGFGTICTHGRKTVRRVESTSPMKDSIDFIYDPAVGKLSVRWNWFRPEIPSHDSHHSAFLNHNIVYHWNRKDNCLEIYNDDNQTTTRLPHYLDIREIKTSMGFKRPLGRVRSVLHDDEPRLLAFGDREVFGLASDDGVQIWFFNPRFVPDVPGAKRFIPMGNSLGSKSPRYVSDS